MDWFGRMGGGGALDEQMRVENGDGLLSFLLERMGGCIVNFDKTGELKQLNETKLHP